MSADFDNALPPTFPGRPNHVVDRWTERGEAETHIVTAWFEAVNVSESLDEVLDDGLRNHVQGDRVRYHGATDTLLVRKDCDLVTVLDVATCEDNRLRSAIRELFGQPDDRDDIAGDGS